MKQFLSTMKGMMGFGLILLVSVFFCGQNKHAQELAAKPPMTIYAYKVSTPPIIDGNISEFLTADSVHFYHKSAPAVDHAVAYVLWDKDNLYIAFDTKNRNLRAKATERDCVIIMQDDLPEVLIDCNNDKSEKWSADDICYHVNILGAIRDDRGMTPDGKDADLLWNGKIDFKCTYKGTLNDSSDVDEGLICEMAIPWSEIQREPKEGLVMGIDFAHNDRSDVDGSYRYYDWCQLNVFHSPSKFGEIMLKGEL